MTNHWEENEIYSSSSSDLNGEIQESLNKYIWGNKVSIQSYFENVVSGGYSDKKFVNIFIFHCVTNLAP